MKLKNYILSLVLVFTNFLVNAQELFSPAGTSVSTSTVVFEYAIGDIIVGSADNSNFHITQGFSQPRSSSAPFFYSNNNNNPNSTNNWWSNDDGSGTHPSD